MDLLWPVVLIQAKYGEGREEKEQILEIQILSKQTLQDNETLKSYRTLVLTPDVSPVQ